MRKYMLIILLAAFSGNATAEWYLATKSSDEKVSFYVDLSTIRRNKSKVKMWTLHDHIEDQSYSENTYLSAKAQEEFDCDEEQARLIYISLHSLNMGGGKTVRVINEKQLPEFAPLAPDSSSLYILQIACGKVTWKNQK